MIKQNIILLLIFISNLTLGMAQETVKNQFDNDGKRHGLWSKNFDKTDQPRYEGQFEHGKEIGLFKYYKLVNGKSKLSATKDFNKETGIAEVKFMSSKGKLISEGQMKGRLYIGKWIYYHDNSDAVMSTETYNDKGKLQGEKLVYYDNGKIAERVHYEDGKINGLNTWYSENGNILKEMTYKDDELHGLSKYYDGDGQLLVEGRYDHDKKTGIWKYYEDGKLKEEKDYTVKSKNPIKQ